MFGPKVGLGFPSAARTHITLSGEDLSTFTFPCWVRRSLGYVWCLIGIGTGCGNPHVRIQHKGYHTACQRLVQFNVHCSPSKGPQIVMGQFTDKKLQGKMKRSDGSPPGLPKNTPDTSTTVYPTSRISRIGWSPTCDEVGCLVPNHLNVTSRTSVSKF